MKIHHHIEFTPDDLDSMFDSIVSTCLELYPTTEAQTTAINVIKKQTQDWLTIKLNTAFTYGENVGVAHGTAMYTELYMSIK
jgi:hypothetical protein